MSGRDGTAAFGGRPYQDGENTDPMMHEHPAKHKGSVTAKLARVLLFVFDPLYILIRKLLHRYRPSQLLNRIFGLVFAVVYLITLINIPFFNTVSIILTYYALEFIVFTFISSIIYAVYIFITPSVPGELKEIIIKCLINYITIWFPVYFILYYFLFIFINQDADFIPASLLSGLIELPLPAYLETIAKSRQSEMLLLYFILFSFIFAFDFWNYYFFQMPRLNERNFANAVIHEAKIVDHSVRLEGTKFLYPVIHITYKIGRRTRDLYDSKIGFSGFIGRGTIFFIEYEPDTYQALFNRAYGKDTLDHYFFLFENGNPVASYNYLFSGVLCGVILMALGRLTPQYGLLVHGLIGIYALVMAYLCVSVIRNYLKPWLQRRD